ncbi:hypothetical protein D3C87_596790 [compost metagenome]|uniref:hypothetical protein n=1 Tax=Chryseobacterium sp. 5_R23647 TaxID=2258964 RepID=UPI000E22763F|nr:hypothetical protein [Chryseobacterium sp. 5_R23647]REC42027.1 hypothetical protein DRF69_12755 [Chryseobacterium sp. 5_R23647]
MRRSKIKYISKDMVAQKSRSAFKQGAIRAMNTNGYVVIAHEGWVVKKHSNGNIERLQKIGDEAKELKVILD